MGDRRTWVWLALAAAAVLAVVSASDARGFRHYVKMQGEIADLSERNKKLAAENQKLSREIEALRTDPQALERAAREELGFIKPGEIVLHLE
jgi:cell division protein FtsB